MKIEEIKKILENKLTDLNMNKQQAVLSGNLELVIKITTEIDETLESLSTLNNL